MYMTQEVNHFTNIYMPNGLKPLEAFFSDISNHIVRWAARSDGEIYYETKEYWYRFAFENTDVGRMSGIVWIRRFELDSNKEITIFTNKQNISNMCQKWHFNKIDNKVPVE